MTNTIFRTARSRRSRDAFTHVVTCVVINLDSRPDRWRRVQKMCRRHGIEPRRFSAHDGDRARREVVDSPLSPAELGIWSSYRHAALTECSTDWILILEDDALLLPRFRYHVLADIDAASPEVIAIRMGWLGSFAIRPSSRPLRYLLKAGHGALSSLPAAVRRLSGLQKILRTPNLWGAHAVLVRRSRVSAFVDHLGPPDAPLDHAFVRLETSLPASFVRSSRNRVWQRIGVSDIQADRRRRANHEDVPGSKHGAGKSP